MTTKTTQSNGKAPSLLEQHRELIAQYDKTAGAARAAASRRIVEAQVSMAIEGIEYTPWQRPSTVRTSYELSPDQLRTQVVALRGIVADEKYDDATKAAAERRLSKFEEQAQKRSIEL
jgi:hypothetical protein